jgi:hypothetical protein
MLHLDTSYQPFQSAFSDLALLAMASRAAILAASLEEGKGLREKRGNRSKRQKPSIQSNVLLLMPSDSVLRRLLTPVSLALLLCPALLNKAVKAVIVAAHDVLFPHLWAALARRPRLSRPNFIGNAGLAPSLTRDELFYNLVRRLGRRAFETRKWPGGHVKESERK